MEIHNKKKTLVIFAHIFSIFSAFHSFVRCRFPSGTIFLLTKGFPLTFPLMLILYSNKIFQLSYVLSTHTKHLKYIFKRRCCTAFYLFFIMSCLFSPAPFRPFALILSNVFWCTFLHVCCAGNLFNIRIYRFLILSNWGLFQPLSFKCFFLFLLSLLSFRDSNYIYIMPPKVVPVYRLSAHSCSVFCYLCFIDNNFYCYIFNFPHLFSLLWSILSNTSIDVFKLNVRHFEQFNVVWYWFCYS